MKHKIKTIILRATVCKNQTVAKGGSSKFFHYWLFYFICWPKSIAKIFFREIEYFGHNGLKHFCRETLFFPNNWNLKKCGPILVQKYHFEESLVAILKTCVARNILSVKWLFSKNYAASPSSPNDNFFLKNGQEVKKEVAYVSVFST